MMKSQRIQFFSETRRIIACNIASLLPIYPYMLQFLLSYLNI